MIPENFQTNIKARSSLSKTFTGKRLSKISEEFEPERIEETENKAEDITENRAENITEVISEDKTEHEKTEKRTTDRTFERPENQTDDRTEDTLASSREEIQDDENVSEDSTGSTAQTIRVDNNQIENFEMDLPLGKFGKSFIVIIVFAGIGSLVTIEIHTRTQNRLNVDDPRTFFKTIIAL